MNRDGSEEEKTFLPLCKNVLFPSRTQLVSIPNAQFAMVSIVSLWYSLKSLPSNLNIQKTVFVTLLFTLNFT